MGAIFLFRDENNIDLNEVLDVFDRKHFSSPHSYKCAGWTIYSWPKMNGIADHLAMYEDVTLISIGTPIYKGLDYSESLNELVRNFYDHKLIKEELIGQYTLFFFGPDGISVICDSLGTKHLYTDRDLSVISSSFLAIACAMKGKLEVNRRATYEKLLTGFITAPDTLFSEIYQVSGELYDAFNQADNYIRFISVDAILKTDDMISCANEAQCIDRITKELKCYFRHIQSVGNNGIDAGMSGGYDSRLILACLHKFVGSKIHLHSHATENDHNGELKIANKMAEYVGIPCHTVSTKRLNHTADPDRIMEESVLFFDGRTSFAIGGCGEVYTADYRKQAIGNSPMTLTGVGGELFRNVFNLGWSRIRFDWFMREKAFSVTMRKALDSDVLKDVESNIIQKTASRLKIKPSSWNGKEIAHRYYCEVVMPDGQGNVIDAYNQVSCCTAPFLEPSIIRQGYEGICYHGAGGDFEGKLIDMIDRGLASIDSTYGYPLNKRPNSARVKEFIRSYVPDRLWQFLSDYAKGQKKTRRSRTYEDAVEICAKGSELEKALNNLFAMFPEIHFSYLLEDEESVRRIIFLAMTFHFISKYREHRLSE